MNRSRTLLATSAAALLVAVVAVVVLATRDDRPRAEVGWVLQGGYALEDETGGRTTRVEVPWGSLDVTVGEPRGKIDQGKVLAPEDGSLVWISVEPDAQVRPLPRTPTTRVQLPEIAVVADGRTYPVLRPGPVPAGPSMVPLQRTSAWVALASRPDRVAVRVTYDDRSQTIGADGEVEAGDFAALEDVRSGYDAQDCGRVRITPGFTPYRYPRLRKPSCTVDWFTRAPYVGGLGWAEEGRTWLVFSVTSAAGLAVVRDGDPTTLDSQTKRRTFTLDGRDPEAVLSQSEVGGQLISALYDPDLVVFDAPAGKSTGTLRVSHVSPLNDDAVLGGAEPERVTFRWVVDVASL